MGPVTAQTFGKVFSKKKNNQKDKHVKQPRREEEKPMVGGRE